MWIFPSLEEYLLNSLTFDVVNLIVFRVTLGVSVLLKYIIEVSRGFPNHAKRGSFIYEEYIKEKSYRIFFSKIYLYTFHLRFIFAILLIVGLKFKIISIILFIIIFSEMYVMFRYHLVVGAIAILAIVLDGNIQSLPFSSIKSNYQLYCPSLIFIKYLPIFVYLSSSLRKIQFGFIDGFVLREGAIFSLTKRNYPDHFGFLTKEVSKKVIIPNSETLGKLVIVLQILIPILLLIGGGFKYLGVMIGLFLHIGITALFPRTLLFFSIMLFGILILWL